MSNYIVTCFQLGTDIFGDNYLQNFKDNGVNIGTVLPYFIYRKLMKRFNALSNNILCTEL